MAYDPVTHLGVCGVCVVVLVPTRAPVPMRALLVEMAAGGRRGVAGAPLCRLGLCGRRPPARRVRLMVGGGRRRWLVVGGWWWSVAAACEAQGKWSAQRGARAIELRSRGAAGAAPAQAGRRRRQQAGGRQAGRQAGRADARAGVRTSQLQPERRRRRLCHRRPGEQAGALGRAGEARHKYALSRGRRWCGSSVTTQHRAASALAGLSGISASSAVHSWDGRAAICATAAAQTGEGGYARAPAGLARAGEPLMLATRSFER